MRAKNFSDEELCRALEKCAGYGVRTYVTVNTRLSDRELPDVVSLAERLSPETKGEAEAAVRQTLAPFAHGHYDAALLGCTHFSALAAPISRALGGIPTLDGAALAARAPAETLPKKRQGLGGKTILYTNGESRAFARAAAHILGKELPVLRAYENKNH
jgi:glutamate racemase